MAESRTAEGNVQDDSASCNGRKKVLKKKKKSYNDGDMSKRHKSQVKDLPKELEQFKQQHSTEL